MSTILKERQVKRTRKDRRCDWCGDWVKAGDASVSMSANWDGDFSSTRYHPDCHKAWKDTLSSLIRGTRIESNVLFDS